MAVVGVVLVVRVRRIAGEGHRWSCRLLGLVPSQRAAAKHDPHRLILRVVLVVNDGCPANERVIASQVLIEGLLFERKIYLVSDRHSCSEFVDSSHTSCRGSWAAESIKLL